MTKRITTEKAHYWKVRVVLPGALLHVASSTEPKVETDGRINHVTADWLQDPECGDTIGYIHWPDVTAVTWRSTEER